MKRRTINSTLSSLGIAILLATTAIGATVNVDVGPGGSMSFSPNSVSITAGDTVQWNWKSTFHSVTSDSADESYDSGVHTSLPFSFTHTFSTPGSFPYHCTCPWHCDERLGPCCRCGSLCDSDSHGDCDCYRNVDPHSDSDADAIVTPNRQRSCSRRTAIGGHGPHLAGRFRRRK